MSDFQILKIDENSVRVRHTSSHEFTFNYAFDGDERRILANGMAHPDDLADVDFAELAGAAYLFARDAALKAGTIDL